PNSEDPPIEHPMSHRLIQILETCVQMPLQGDRQEASFCPPPSLWRSSEADPHLPARSQACGEMQMHHALISSRLLAELCTLPAVSFKAPASPSLNTTKSYANGRHPTPARLADVSKSDPLAADSMDRHWQLASTEVDYSRTIGRRSRGRSKRTRRLYDAASALSRPEPSSK
ncbi:hypothetical protein C8F04DRAFT_916044, partial [Mycena alexandri]